MSSTKRKKVLRSVKKSLNIPTIVIVKHITVPAVETEKLKKINKMLAKAKFMD
jgi:hypothetical protein